MSKSAKKPSISLTRRDFYRKCRVPYVPRDPPEPRDTYVPQAIRESHSYGPRSQKYDEYIELYGDSDDSEQSTASRNKAFNQENLAKIRKYDLKTLRTIHEKIYESKTPAKPILHCFSTATEPNSSLTAKKSAPIKKISFALPDDKYLLDHERMDWKDYHPLEVIHEFMDDLEADFPSICTTGSIGLSVEGRHLKILKISNSNANNVAVWMDAGIHAREWIAPAVNTYIANHISRNFETLPENVTNKDWYFLPVVNPDGYHYSHTTNRMWRKNRANHIGHPCGVDLNRNFGIGWGGRGSSNLPNNSFYRGPHPFSEPESSAMRDVLSNSGIKFQVYITLHSYGQIIIFPYSCTTEMAPDYVHLLEGATAMSKAIYKTNGETYKVGISRDVMYAASGTSNDFAHGGAGIPYCYLIELRSKKHKFKLPKEQIEDTGNEILSSVLALMEFVETYSYQNKIDQKIDLLLEKNDSLTGSCSFVNTAKSHLKQCESYNRRSYSYLKQSDSLVKTQSSYVRLTHLPGERDDSVEESSDSEWPDCIKNKEVSLEKNTNTSEKETCLYKKVEESNDVEGPDGLRNRDKSLEKNTNTSEKGTGVYNNSKESSDDEWPEYAKNRDKSVESNVSTSEKETSVYKKYNDSKDLSAPFPLYYDSSTQKPESSNDASGGTDSYLNQTESLTIREDSYETWNSFYKHKNDFVEKRNHLLQTGASFGAADVKCKVAPSEQRSQVWELSFPEEGQRQFVKTLDNLGAINIWNEQRSTMEIMVEGSRAGQVAGLLHERDIPFLIAITDLSALLEKEQNTSIAINLVKPTPKTMDWHSYHTLDTIYAFLDNLQAEYPYLCSIHVIGKSAEGRDLKMLKISNGEKTNFGVWLDGAIHPREWISPAVVTYLANSIVRSFNEMPDSVTNKDWYILPVMNPDGYVYTHTHDRMWRKNRARYGELVGVDLNRNFSYGFGEKGEEGSSDDPGSVFYRGPKAFSEPETAAVKRLITSAPTTFKAFLSFHSYGEVIIFPWGYTSDSCPDYVDLLEGGTAMAKAIFTTSGHTYKVGSTKDLMYYAAGTSIDWSYAVPNIPYSYMIELRSKTHRFLLPKEEIITSAKEIQNGVFRLMAFVDQRCTGTQTCACPK